MGRLGVIVVGVCALVACNDGGAARDAAGAGGGDGAVVDASAPGGGRHLDASARDAAARVDARAGDAAAAADAASRDAGRPDAANDAGTGGDGGAAAADAGTMKGDCISGATGTYEVRFRWLGSSDGSAYVDYEENQLPDTSRWKVSAASASIGYTPTYTDTFLGEGGLDLEGSAFIDVELSTVGLSSIRNVAVAIYGRSFNTTASGSFSWQTFDGTGATPDGSVANSVPYAWYPADATASFSPGDSGVLVRLRPGPPSNALIVDQVELCFDAN